MFGSLCVYAGSLFVLAGLILAIKPARWLHAWTLTHGVAIGALGLVLVVIGFVLPARESRVAVPRTHLDALMPRWQFHEVHTTRVAAPPAVVFDAIRQVKADEILLFRTLTWIRRGGRPAPESILNAGDEKSLIDVATSSGFVQLAADPPRELVIGTVVVAPPGTRGTLTAEVFQKPLPPGFALATMNFLVIPDGPDRCVVSTETRIFANSDAARRRFAKYWRVIYPGSALIRRMWLRAIERRAVGQNG